MDVAMTSMDRFAFLDCLPYFHRYRGKKWPPTLQPLEYEDENDAGSSLISLPLFFDQKNDRETVVSIEASILVDLEAGKNSISKSKTTYSVGPIGFEYGAGGLTHDYAQQKPHLQQSSCTDPCLCRFEAVLTNLHPPDAAELGLMAASSPSGSSTTTTTHVSGSQSSISAQGSTRRNPGRSLLSSLLSSTPKSSVSPGQGKSPRSMRTQPTPMQGRAGCSPRMIQGLSPNFKPHLFFRFDEKHTVFVDYSQLKSARFVDESSEGKLPPCLLLDFDGCSFRIFSQSCSSLHREGATITLTPTAANNQSNDGDTVSSSLLNVKSIFSKHLLGRPCTIPESLDHDEDNIIEKENFVDNSDPSSDQPGQREDDDYDHNNTLESSRMAETQAAASPLSLGLHPKEKERGSPLEAHSVEKEVNSSTKSNMGSSAETSGVGTQLGERKEILEEAMKVAFEKEHFHSIESCQVDRVLDAAEEIIHPLYRKRKRVTEQGWLALESVIEHEGNTCDDLEPHFSEIGTTFSKQNNNSIIERQDFGMDLQNCDDFCDELDDELKVSLETLFPGPRTRGSRGAAAYTLSMQSQGDMSKDEAHHNIIHHMRKRQIAIAARHLIALEGCNKI